MINLFYIFLGIVVLRLVINVTKYFQCKHYLKEYLHWVVDPTWGLVEHKSKVLKLLQDAGVKDSHRGIAQPLGFMQIQTSNVSVMANFPNRRDDFFVLTRGMLHQAIGVYRSRILETFNPLYWIEFIVNFPKQVLSYLGVSPEKLVVKIAQFVYWVVGAVVGFLLTLFRPEIETLVRDWLNGLFP
jgi:hypothetical protein